MPVFLLRLLWRCYRNLRIGGEVIVDADFGFRWSRTTGNILYSYELVVSRVACDREKLGYWLIDIISRVTYDRKYICMVMVIDVSRVAFDQKHDIEIHLYHFAGSVQQERHRDYKQKVALRLYTQISFRSSLRPENVMLLIVIDLAINCSGHT